MFLAFISNFLSHFIRISDFRIILRHKQACAEDNIIYCVKSLMWPSLNIIIIFFTQNSSPCQRKYNYKNSAEFSIKARNWALIVLGNLSAHLVRCADRENLVHHRYVAPPHEYSVSFMRNRARYSLFSFFSVSLPLFLYCLFCTSVAAAHPAENLILHANDHTDCIHLINPTTYHICRFFLFISVWIIFFSFGLKWPKKFNFLFRRIPFILDSFVVDAVVVVSIFVVVVVCCSSATAALWIMEFSH